MSHRERKCKYCRTILTGRVDQKFCSAYCRSAYHYEKGKNKEASFYQQVDKQLKLNRRLLKNYNRAGKATVRGEILDNEGFNPKYFTHYWKNKKGQVYLFCYEFGFLAILENDKRKYVLVKWQAYMDG